MKIVALEPLGISKEKALSVQRLFGSSNHEFVIYSDKIVNEDVMVERSKDADVLIVSNIPIRESFIRQCPKLRMISVAFTGVDHINLEACQKRGIKVCNAAGYATHAVAEITISLMLSVMRKIPVSDYATRSMNTSKGFLGTELYGKTVGIVGTGKIGLRVAELCKAFGCNILGYNRSQKEEAKQLGLEYVPIEQLLLESDIISIHLPLTNETKDFIGKEQIKYMKPSAILINTARAGIVDTTALSVALKINRIAGAGIDVYEMEPPIPKQHPFRELPNTVLLPHIGYSTHEAISNRIDIVVENIIKWFEGKPQNVIV